MAEPVDSMSPAPTIGVVVATRGRAPDVCTLLDRLAAGTRRPDRVVVVGCSPGDWAGAETSDLHPTTLASPEPGLTRQRNVGVRHLRGQGLNPDVIAFFDDDFRPHPLWLENALTTLTHDPAMGMTGIILRDGAKGAAVSESEASRLLAEWDPAGRTSRPVPWLYGCNMAVRSTIFDHVAFDERLPLYGWLEDLDFSEQIGGRLVVADGCGGVHLGAKSGRISGLRYGYSQIVNPIYLARKGTCSKGLAARLAMQSLVSNAVRSIGHHPLFDYRGRLAGNIRAVMDTLQNRARPERITEM